MVPQGMKEKRRKKKLANGLTCPSLTDNTPNSFMPQTHGTKGGLESAFGFNS